MCDIPLDKNNYGIIDIMDFEEIIKVNIALYSMESKIIYPGALSYENTIYILHDNDHFNVITNLNGFEAKDSYHNRNRNKKCKGCGSKTKCIYGSEKIGCETCNKIFFSKQCFENHQFNNYCLDHSYRCIDCNRYFKTKNIKMENHNCNEYYCNNCEAYRDIDHECFMKKTKFKQVSDKYIFYDFESKKDVDNNHIVNYAIAHDMAGKKYTFHNIDEFCKWAFTKQHKGHTFIAHYGKGYDIQFVMKWLIDHNVVAKPIVNGEKILILEVKFGYNIRFIDSFSFIPLPLRDFPKTFGLEEMAKGYFPHYFNTDENQDYEGKYPDKNYYGYKEMTIKDKEVFDEWYLTMENKTFNFKKEMDRYCNSDVDILRNGCLKYRDILLNIFGIDPFQYITLASVANAIYRFKYMPEKTIPFIENLFILYWHFFIAIILFIWIFTLIILIFISIKIMREISFSHFL